MYIYIYIGFTEDSDSPWPRGRRPAVRAHPVEGAPIILFVLL